MGIWGSIAKGIVGALPVVGPIIEGGIEAATAKKASNQQVQSGQRAMDIQDKVYQQQQALLQPYYNTGTAAFTTLGGLLGLPSTGGGGGGMPVSPMGALGSTPPPQSNMVQGPIQPTSYDAHGGYLPPMAPSQRAQLASSVSGSSYGPLRFGQASLQNMPMAKVKAPDGTIYSVPKDQLAQAIQNGGEEV